MKKLLIAVSAAACALGAFAALTEDSKVTFEEDGYTVNNPLNLANDDDGDAAATSGKGQWYSATPADVDATVTAYATPPEVGNNNYLNIESTGKPLYRLIHGMTTPDVATATTETMGTVYIDTMVQFTAGDPDMTSDEAGAKLALWVCGNDAEGDPAATTNFMVKAGCFDNGTFTSGIYKMAAPEGVTFEKDAWYRLTVKSYANVGVNDGQTYQGFVVFVGDEALTPVDYTLPDWVTVPEKFADALVLSMVANDNTLAAVGFSGTGAIDDVTFTTKAPEFAEDAQFFTVAWTNGVASIAFGSDTNITCTTDVGSALLPLVFATNDVTVTYQSGYVAGDWEKGTITAGDTLTIKGILATCSYEDGEGNTVYVATLADAIAKANGTTVTLTADIPAGDPISVANTVIIDLAGRTLNCGFTVTTGGSLTINDTTGGGAVVAESVIVFDAGDITLNAGKYTGAITFDSEADYNGTFTIANDTKFKDYGDLLADLIDEETQQLSGLDTDGFVTVQEKQATVITIVDANVTLSAESATYTGSSVAPTVTVVVNETTLVEGTDYDVTIPQIVDAGSYAITVTGKVSYAGTVSKTFTVNAKAITPTLTLSATAGVFGSEGLALPTVTVADGEATLDAANYDLAWDPSEITAAGDYVVTVTLKGNYSGSNTATFTVTAPAPVVTPVTPGSEGATVTAGSEQAAKDAVEITVPTDIDATGYRGLFDKVATSNGDGTFTVTVQLTTEAETEIKTEADAVVKTVDLTAAAAVAVDGTLAPIAAEDLTPGIYYSVEVADNLGFTGGQEGDRVMAGANGTANIPMPNPKALENANGNARFFRVKANVKDKDNK